MTNQYKETVRQVIKHLTVTRDDYHKRITKFKENMQDVYRKARDLSFAPIDLLEDRLYKPMREVYKETKELEAIEATLSLAIETLRGLVHERKAVHIPPGETCD